LLLLLIKEKTLIS